MPLEFPDISVERRLEEFGKELRANGQMKSDLIRKLPLGFNDPETLSARVGYDTGKWDPQPVSEFLVEKKFFAPYYDMIDELEKDGTYRNISVLNSLKSDFFDVIYVKNRLMLDDDIYEPVLIPRRGYVFTHLCPYIFSFAGKSVTGEDFLRKAYKHNTPKKYLKKAEKVSGELDRAAGKVSAILKEDGFNF